MDFSTLRTITADLLIFSTVTSMTLTLMEYLYKTQPTYLRYNAILIRIRHLAARHLVS